MSTGVTIQRAWDELESSLPAGWQFDVVGRAETFMQDPDFDASKEYDPFIAHAKGPGGQVCEGGGGDVAGAWYDLAANLRSRA